MRSRRGMSLIEVLLGLSIGAMLFTAVAGAVYASSNAMKGNERYFKATQAARIAMLQMTTTIRQSESCNPGSPMPIWPAWSSIPTGDDPSSHTVAWDPTSVMNVNRLLIVNGTAKVVNFVYRWNRDTRELTYGPEPAQTGMPGPAVLARNVTDLVFRAQSWPRIDPNAPDTATLQTNGIWELSNIQIDMVVTVDNQPIHLSNSVVPRKAMVVR